MESLEDNIQKADWKNEKHVPVIETPDEVRSGEKFTVKVQVGKEISHPNTVEHHIKWMSLFFKPDDDKFIYNLGNYDLSSHGESVKAPNEGPAISEPEINAVVTLKKSGTLISSSYCNIHGLWEHSKTITVK